MAADQSPMNKLITEHIDIWTSAVKTKSISGRGSSKKLELYGIKKLRELIIELAIQGKLTASLDFKGSAKKSVEDAIVAKFNLSKERNIRGDKETYSSDRAKGFPLHWETICVGQVAHVLGGKRVPKGYKLSEQPTDFVYLRVTDMKNQSIDESDLRYISEEVFKQISRYTINTGDVYVTIAGTIGAVGTIPPHLDGMSLTENAAKLVFSGLSKKYLVTVLQSSFVTRQFNDAVNQMAQPKLSLNSIKHTCIPIPPLEEQEYIADKVDELMALCDQLEQQTEASIEAHQVLVTTLLDTLTNSADADELMQNWARISEHFDTLFTTEESIDQLKQTILQLAVMGKLIPQDPSDEPAAELLKRIEEEKAQLVKDKKIKKQKALPPISGDEKPFELPSGWEWCRLGHIWQDSFYGPRFGKNEYVDEGGYPTIRTTDMTKDGVIELNNPPRVSMSDEKLKLYALEKGDLLITRSGSIGIMALFDLDIRAIPSAYLIRVRLTDYIYPKFVLTLLMSPLGQSYLGINATAVGVPNVNATKMASFPFPVPSLAEQIKIVEKVAALFDLCEQLKDCISNTQKQQLQITETFVELAV
ncbi:restriction endonuclease subunit S [Vibrio parahaemolyticus]|uniref:restriction endonuclease subunit S n=1 Tax=Vibrio TaxID=662 RepID=UPI00071FE00C|nr:MULTISPECIES: restriction endonuclease subunit S [Vibrio]ALM71977.1 Type I restriction-modification system, specificity subunit S [Vibrio vulnificus]ANH62221.1 Type I restriction-modification system, specificity subunit S [Vibrio vulnificus]APC86222.1 Type I restriction-modification system, specificity subunit S [Vibrio parahaemolyticus]EJC6763234.1 restriction endonuclease subunit S [Vibrio parahaemolyticus]EJC6783253.1 restriction endonuclease subunit S [Vibrio parahaemolyticus]